MLNSLGITHEKTNEGIVVGSVCLPKSTETLLTEAGYCKSLKVIASRQTAVYSKGKCKVTAKLGNKVEINSNGNIKVVSSSQLTKVLALKREAKIPNEFTGVYWYVNNDCVVVVNTEAKRVTKDLAESAVNLLATKYPKVLENYDAWVNKAKDEISLAEFNQSNGSLSYNGITSRFGGSTSMNKILYTKRNK